MQFAHRAVPPSRRHHSDERVNGEFMIGRNTKHLLFWGKEWTGRLAITAIYNSQNENI
jgi:hypothetical protein